MEKYTDYNRGFDEGYDEGYEDGYNEAVDIIGAKVVSEINSVFKTHFHDYRDALRFIKKHACIAEPGRED